MTIITHTLILAISCGLITLSACSKPPVSSQISPQASQTVSQSVSAPASPEVTPVSAASAPTKHETTYGQCTQDSDCVITKNACGMVTAVNEQSLNAYRKNQDRLSQVMRCAKPPVIDMSKLSTQCSEGYCRMSGLAEQLAGTIHERP